MGQGSGMLDLPAAALRCRMCGYSFAGLRAEDEKWTCPECGVSGPPADIAFAPPAVRPRWYRVMLGFCAIPTVLLALLSAVLIVAAWTRTVEPMIGLGIIVLSGYVITVFAIPAQAGLDLAERLVPPFERRKRYWTGVALSLAGILVNVVIGWVTLTLLVRAVF